MGLFDFFKRRRQPPPKPPRPETPEEAIRRREGRRAEVRKGIGRSVLPEGPTGEELFGGGAGRPAPAVGKRGHGYRSKTAKRPNWVHVDAAFDDDENAAFLLGLLVECRSSWVKAARWNEEASTLSLTIAGKVYDFPGIDFEKANVFSRYGSKGRWFWEVWKGEYHRAAGEFPLLDQVPLPGR